MKKIILFIGLIFISNLVFSQKISSLNPTMVVWENNSEKITLSQARYGVVMKDSLSLDVYFSKFVFDRIKAKSAGFEFRWYYFLSTRRSLMYVEKVDFDEIKELSDGNLLVHSTQQKLQPGWWEVQVFTTYDNGLLEIANTSKFQILIKK
ncbi:MAG: hypothetical protein JXR68_09810 [Bacteroidales bacterium]|nr:hypothetical protein [Bacteroidales bacterium]